MSYQHPTLSRPNWVFSFSNDENAAQKSGLVYSAVRKSDSVGIFSFSLPVMHAYTQMDGMKERNVPWVCSVVF